MFLLKMVSVYICNIQGFNCGQMMLNLKKVNVMMHLTVRKFSYSSFSAVLNESSWSILFRVFARFG